MNEELKQLQSQVNDLLAWKASRENQQISYPIDDASLNTIAERLDTGISPKGNGSSTLTQSVNVPSTPTNITVPKGYVDTIILEIGGIGYEIPYIAVV